MNLAKRVRLLIPLFLFLSAIPTLSAYVNAEENKTLRRGQIIIGSELDYPPYALVTKDGKPDGFSVDLIKAVCETMGIKYTFQVGSWNEVRGALEKQKIDALPLVGYTKERDILFDFTKPHTPSYGVIFRHTNAPEIESLGELKGKTIIAMKSDNTHDYLVSNNITRKIIEATTMDEVLNLLKSGKYEYAIGPRLVGLLLLKEHAISNIEVTGPLIEAYGPGFSFAVQNGDALLLSLLNQGLSVVKADGTYEKIYQKWFGIIDPEEVISQETIQKIMFAITGMIFIVLITFIWSLSLRRKVSLKTSELLEAKHQYQDLYDNSPDMYASVDAKTTCIKQCNQTLVSELGLSMEEIIGKPIFELYHSDCMDEVKKAFNSFITTGIVRNAELQLRRNDGSKLEVSLNVSAIRDDEGNILHSRSVWRDNTERKEMIGKLKELNANLEKLVAEEVEKNRVKDQVMFKQSRHLEMAELLVNIAHQWRQPICAIGAIAQDVEDAYRFKELNEEYLHESVETIMTEIEGLSKTIKQFSTFFAKEQDRVEFSIESGIQKSIDLLERELKRMQVDVVLDVAEECRIVGFPNEFAQAVYNIMNNAVEISEERKVKERKITIKVSWNKENGKTRVEIADNNGGIDGKILERVFDPYYTTRDKSRGKGVGLFMSKTIVETNMHGKLWAENTPEGANFIIEV